MIFRFLKDLFDPSVKIVKSVQGTVDKIDLLEKEFENLSFEDFKNKFATFRKNLKSKIDQIPQEYRSSLISQNKGSDYVMLEESIKEELLSYLPEVYAAIREVLKRKVGYSHFRVQMVASAILAQGYKLTELKTGEGKTLVFQLPAALYGLTGRGSHVVTVNDYLARRDGEYAGHILSEVGVTVGIITPQQAYRFVKDEDVPKYKGEEIKELLEKQKIINPGDCEGINLIECSKKEAYACDVVYGTNNEFGFDYLRDNMTHSTEEIVQKELYFCIVDEADSILIDEARTPLIISSAAEQSNELYIKFARLVPKLKEEEDYTVDEKAHAVMLTDEGAEKMEKMLGVKNIWQDYRLAHHLENALKAERLYKNNDEYIVKDGEVLIVDDFTGRILEGRRYSEGLHQAIEAKEGVEIKRESKTLGTITFQNFFRLYKILSGGSGTVMTEAEEFYKIYNLESVVIPTNKPVTRVDHTDRVYKDKVAKFNAVTEEVIELHTKGQPVLIGTATIQDSEYLSKQLEGRGIEHQVLNAKMHERESKIVANAGKKNAVTVATNMAGRGTDIKLGGKNATDDEFNEVVALGGLVVIGTQRHDSRRIDNQLRGRSGRQGEPGMSRFYVSLDDDIMRIQGGEIVQRIMSFTKLPEDMPIESGLIGNSIESAQKRMEGMHFDSRKTVVEYDDVVNQQREIFYSRRRRILESIVKAEAGALKTDESKESLNSLKDFLWEKIENEVHFILNTHFIDVKDIKTDIVKVVEDFMDLAPDELINDSFKKNSPDSEVSNLKEKLISFFEGKKKEEVEAVLMAIIKEVFDKKIDEFGGDLGQICRFLILGTMDELWTEHLEDMKAIRDGIGLRGFAQQDPLVEYKNEGFEVFDKFINNIDTNISRRMLKIQKVITPVQAPTEKIVTNENEVEDVLTGSREVLPQINRTLSKLQNRPLRTEKQKTVVNSIAIGRNDLCPCGSGLKYKKCGMINGPKHRA